jgi:hypothetical protein
LNLVDDIVSIGQDASRTAFEAMQMGKKRSHELKLQVGHLYKVMDGNYAGRKYLVEEVGSDQVRALEGWFRYTTTSDRASPEDIWTWSPEGSQWVSVDRLESVRDVGRIPEPGEPRFRFRWGMEER